MLTSLILDGQGPDRTGPDQTSVRVSGLRPDFVVDFPRKARLEKPDLLKMADDREIDVGSLITLACSLGAANLLLKKKRKHSEWVKKYTHQSQQYGECNTLGLLPCWRDIPPTEFANCLPDPDPDYRNLLLRKW